MVISRWLAALESAPVTRARLQIRTNRNVDVVFTMKSLLRKRSLINGVTRASVRTLEERIDGCARVWIRTHVTIRARVGILVLMSMSDFKLAFVLIRFVLTFITVLARSH